MLLLRLMVCLGLLISLPLLATALAARHFLVQSWTKKRYGKPTDLDNLNLRQHLAVQYFSNRTGRIKDMNFVVDGSTTAVKMRGSLAVNDAEAYVMRGVQGAGIVQAPQFMLLPHLRSGKLIEVLPIRLSNACNQYLLVHALLDAASLWSGCLSWCEA